ncbi:hypothetical protein [Congzhengia sp.]|uniref:hypothetical protein n=1 Tax=Congzhengia sp. TaxID=2944168 RepID=UPI003078006C
MKKVIAFLLAAVMCLGFVGCELPGMGLARKFVGKTVGVNAEMVFKELSKFGNLSLEIKYKDVVSDFGGEVPISEKLVFRIINEKREKSGEHACYIEIYPSADDLEKAISVLNKDMKELYKERTYILYTAGSTLLRLDGSLTKDAASKYAEAFQRAIGKEVVYRNSEELPVEKYSISRTFIPPNGVGSREIYDKLKKDLDGLEFFSYLRLRDYDNTSFFEKDEAGKTVIVNICVGATIDDAMKSNGAVDFKIISGNVYMDFLGDISEKRLSQYVKKIEKITGQPIDTAKSKLKK